MSPTWAGRLHRAATSGAVVLLRSNRPYARFFLAQLISRTGDWFSLVALPFAVLSVSHSAADVGFVLASRAVSSALFVLFGGVLADRAKSRRAMIARCNVGRFAIQGLFAILLATGSAHIVEMCLLMAAYGLMSAMANPAITGLIPELVPKADLQSANALNSFTTSSTQVAGPVLAGLLVVTLGPAWALGIDSLSFLGSAALLLRMPDAAKTARPEQPGLISELRQGWSEVRQRSWLLSSLGALSLFQFALMGPLYVLGPLVAARHLGGASAWGIALMAIGVGSVAGDLTALATHPRRVMVAAFASLACCAPVLVLLGLQLPLWAVACGMFCCGFGLSFGDVFWYTAMQANVPGEALSRVSSYDWLATLVLIPAGQAIVGPVSEVIGVGTTLLVAGSLVAAVCLLVMATRGVRRLQLVPAGATAHAIFSQPEAT